MIGSILKVASVTSALCLACSGTPQVGGDGASGGRAIQLGFGGGGSTTNTAQGGRSSSNCGAGVGELCAGISYEAESIPLDIYVMFDQSGSMLNDVGGLTRMEAVQKAVSTFLRDPASAGIGAGIGYFGFQPIGQVSCDANVYAKPDVTISLDHESVINSLSQRMPVGETPTSAALQGACGYAESHRAANPGHAVAILLVTDGKPEAPVSCGSGGCCPTVEAAAQAASACFAGKRQIPTYVLGVGPNLDNLHAIAQAGGTKSAYLVGDQDVTSNVLNALNRIRGAASIPCRIELPESTGGTVDLEQVNVIYSETSCQFKPIYYVARPDACTAEGGWHFDDPNKPSFIQLCSKSCEAVSGAGVALEVSIGCERMEPPIR